MADRAFKIPEIAIRSTGSNKVVSVSAPGDYEWGYLLTPQESRQIPIALGNIQAANNGDQVTLNYTKCLWS